MTRARMLTWGLGLMIATPAIARQWADAPKPVPAPPTQVQTWPTNPSDSVAQAAFRASQVVGEGMPGQLPKPEATPVPVKSVRAGSGPVLPQVSVEKRCPDTVNIGSPLSYEIVVRNVGTTPVIHVRVEDELPPGARYIGGDAPSENSVDRLAWSIGTLEPGAERKVRVEIQPSAEGELRSTAHVTFSAATPMRTQVVCPKLVIAMSGPDNAMAGDRVPFQIQVSNPGSGPVNNLVVRVKLPPGLQHPNGNHIEAEMGTLAAGETRLVPLKTTAGQGGNVVAEVSATGDGVSEASARAEVKLLEAQLQMHRTGPAKTLLKGEILEEFAVLNPGNAAAGNVTIVEMLPQGMEFLAASDGGAYDAANRTVTWKLGSAPAGGRKVITLKTKGTMVGEHVTRTVAAADRGLEAKAEGFVQVEGIPALALEVVDLEDPIEVNGELTYEVRVLNQGSCPCTNIQIQALAPDGLTPIDGAGPAPCRVTGQSVSFDPLPKLGTKADAVFRIKVRGVQPGDFRFKVSMSCDQLKSPVYKEEASRVYKN